MQNRTAKIALKFAVGSLITISVAGGVWFLIHVHITGSATTNGNSSPAITGDGGTVIYNGTPEKQKK
jgi:hypothetical protein